MSLQFIHSNGGLYTQAANNRSTPPLSKDEAPKVLELGTSEKTLTSNKSSASFSKYRFVALGAFFVAMAAGTSMYLQKNAENELINQDFIVQNTFYEYTCNNGDRSQGDIVTDCNGNTNPPSYDSNNTYTTGNLVCSSTTPSNNTCQGGSNCATGDPNCATIYKCESIGNWVSIGTTNVCDSSSDPQIYSSQQYSLNNLVCKFGIFPPLNSNCENPLVFREYICEDNGNWLPGSIVNECNANTTPPSYDNNNSYNTGDSICNSTIPDNNNCIGGVECIAGTPGCAKIYLCDTDGNRLYINETTNVCNTLSNPQVWNFQQQYNLNNQVCLFGNTTPNNGNCENPYIYHEYLCTANNIRNKGAVVTSCNGNSNPPSYDNTNTYFVGSSVCSSTAPLSNTCIQSTNNCLSLGGDQDNDSICSNIDNCPNNFNNNQLDSDIDGLGDVCDSDDDNDGVLDAQEVSGCELLPDCDYDDIQDNIDACPTAFGTLANGCPDTTPIDCNPGATGSCQVSGQFGICQLGTKTCDANGNRGSCLQTKQPTQEICNNLIDDDCDGKSDAADSDCAHSTPKYSCGLNGDCISDPNGQYLTNNCDNMCSTPIKKFSCKSGSCIVDPNGQYTSSTCDNMCSNANSCTPGTSQQCVTDLPGICSVGKQICNGDPSHIDSQGTRGPCQVIIQPGDQKELCSDSLDNDCDGKIDVADGDCSSNTIRYACSNKNCIVDPNGAYTTSTCNHMCSPIDPILKYSCKGGSCVVDGSGTYITATCDNMCSAPTPKYGCAGTSCMRDDINGKYLSATCDNMCSNTTPICGNNKVETSEECDDGNKVNGDGCAQDCRKEAVPNLCGNSKIDTGEECDDGNFMNNDGCNQYCKRDAHMVGGGSYGGGSNYCGDGLKRSSEQCDDGNNKDGDGCHSNCYSELPGNKPSSPSPNRLIVDAISSMVDKLKSTCAYHDKDYVEILQKYKDIQGDDYRDPAVILTTFCITNGYKRKGILGFNMDHYASLYEAIKIIAKINALSEGIQFDETHPDLPRVPYRDVKKGWFTDYVNYAHKAGLLINVARGKELKGFTPLKTQQLEIMLLNAGKDTQDYPEFIRNTPIERDTMAEIVVDIFKEKFVYAEYMMGENIKFYELILKQLQGKSATQQEAFIKNLVIRMKSRDKKTLERKLNIYVDGVIKFLDAILAMK